MKKKMLIGVVLVTLFMSCSSKGDNVTKAHYSFGETITRVILYPFRSGKPFFLSRKAKLAKDLYNAVYGDHVEWVQKILSDGADPNICRGESGWIDSAPLSVVAEDFYDTYYSRQAGEVIPNPAPDVVVLNLLLKAGADINSRPYVWARVYSYNNRFILDIRHERKLNGEKYTPLEIEDHISNFVMDTNRLIEAFLKAGADPDMCGHPYPFSSEAAERHPALTDKEAKEYFAKGSRAINVAIEKGSTWESQVDLLLKYTKLDKDSLDAARRSNDPKMIAKITKLWAEQNRGLALHS